MSKDEMCLFSHKKELDNKNMGYNRWLIEMITILLHEHYSKHCVKKVSADIDVEQERIRHWFYRGNGLTAFDLFLLIRRYDFIEEWVCNKR